MNASQLYRRYSMDQLVAMDEAIRADPANRSPDGALYLYVPRARKKMDEITAAITRHLADARAASGNPVPTCGYSGRQTKRR